MLRVACIFLSISLFSLSMPGSALPWLIWIVYLPVFMVLSQASISNSISILFFSMLGIHAVALSWIYPALSQFTGSSTFLSVLAFILFCVILSIPYAIVGWFISYKKYWGRSIGMVYIAISFTVVFSLFPTYLPGNIAHSLYVYPEIIQVVGIGGIPMLFFFVILVNLLLAKACLVVRKKPESALKSAVSALSLIGLLHGFGSWKIEHQEEYGVQGEKLTIGMIQPKLEREDGNEDLYAMSKKLVSENPDIDLLVWPEIPTRFSYVANRQERARVNKLIASLEKPLVIVSGHVYPTGVNPENPQSEYYNAAHLINADRTLMATYHKQVLVPFFEFLPGEKSLGFLRDLFPEVNRYIPGQTASLFYFSDQVRIIPLICYETIFPEITQRFVKKGGNLILNLSNDIWLGEGHGTDYHFALGMFRSVENNVPWVRVTNSGVSGVVSAQGIIQRESLTDVQSKDTRVYKVYIPGERSIYAENGDVFLYALILFLTISLIQQPVKAAIGFWTQRKLR